MRKLKQLLFSLFFSATVFAQAQAYQQLGLSIDSVLEESIHAKAFPGCVVYASKGDSILFLRSYGYHTYDSLRRVAVNDIYDIASITKVVGATMAVMKLYDDGLIQLDDPLGKYVDGLGSKVGQVTFREALSHQGGLYPWIPYYQEVKKKNGTFKNKTVGTVQNDEYPFAISDSLFLHKDFYLKIKKMIRKSEVNKEKNYRYSGLFFYLVPELVKRLTNESYEDYLTNQFFDKVNAETLTFNPLNHYSENHIVPTEVDTFFRMSPIHGKVHDEGAIMMKGVSGNAGLFSNAEDLGKVFQMLLRNGTVDTLQLLSPSTIQLFTTAQYPNNENRRGLGFDKPLLQYDSIRSSVAKDASFKSFGHSGYTGTLAWADPENDLIFIFLTNRVYPSRTYRAIYQRNVRPSIHQLFYDYLNRTEEENPQPVGNGK